MILFRSCIGFLFFVLLFSCSTDLEKGDSLVSEEENENLDPTNSLSIRELEFLEEYEYVTFNLAPDSFGASVNEKWISDVQLFLDGAISDEYRSKVESTLAQFNDVLSADITVQLVETSEESNIHLIFGEKEAIKEVWPDMFNAIGDVNFKGYALYNRDEDFNIIEGRIWVKNEDIPLFRHELGHTIGLGHASDSYCDGNFESNQSFMCSFLKDELSVFDEAILQTLYDPKVEVGLPFSQLKPIIEELLLTDIIKVE